DPTGGIATEERHRVIGIHVEEHVLHRGGGVIRRGHRGNVQVRTTFELLGGHEIGDDLWVGGADSDVGTQRQVIRHHVQHNSGIEAPDGAAFDVHDEFLIRDSASPRRECGRTAAPTREALYRYR